jgi:hypothetical protein
MVSSLSPHGQFHGVFFFLLLLHHPSAAMYPFTFLPTNEKLTRSNFTSWKAQVVSAVKGAQMGNFLNPDEQPLPAFYTPDGTKADGSKKDPEANPDHASWVAKDQTVLNYLFSNMSKEILGHVNHHVTTAGA